MLLTQKPACGFGDLITCEDLFIDLTPAEMWSLAAVRRRLTLRKSACLFNCGDSPRGVFFLLKGQAEILGDARSNGGNISRLVEPNEVLGLIETIGDLPYKIEVKTISTCLFEFVGREDFIRILLEDRNLCFQLVRSLGRKVQKRCQLARYSII